MAAAHTGAGTDGAGAALPKTSQGQGTTVVIVGARNLRRADWLPGSSSDPYCVCRFAGKAGAGFRTGVARRTQNPMWNARGLPPGYAPGDDLEFELFDKDRFKRDDLLGRATLTSDMLERGCFDGQLPLRDAGHKIEAMLRVRVEVPAPPTPPPPPEASALATHCRNPAPSQPMEIRRYGEFMHGWFERSCFGFVLGFRGLRA